MLTQCSPSPMCHVSHVTCRMSMSHKKNGKSGGASRSRVCYQRGLLRLVLINVHDKCILYHFKILFVKIMLVLSTNKKGSCLLESNQISALQDSFY